MGLLGTHHPPAMYGAAMAYDADPSAQFILMFGGHAGLPTAFTYAGLGIPGSPNPGFLWINLTGLLSLAPPPRYYASMTYDPTLGGVLLFGGLFSGGANDTFGDTWLFTGNVSSPHWTLLSPGDHPSQRGGAALMYDPIDGYDVLFGGSNFPNYYGDTWKFAGGAWTPLRASGPFERAYGDFVWDTALGYGVLTTGDGGAVDLWSFVHGNWTLISPSTPLGGRLHQTVAYNSPDGNLTFFGGENFSLGSDFYDTWNYTNGSTWNELPILGPSARAGQAMTYDPFMGFTVLFGGGTDPKGGILNDTWIFGTFPKSTAPFSVSLGVNPAPALHPLVQPGQNATVTVTPGGGSWPYYVSIRLYGPQHTPGTSIYAGWGTSPVTVNITFPVAADYEIYTNVTSWERFQASTNITYPVGTIVLPNWQPLRDAYSFNNYGSAWSSGGNCYGFSSTTVLYWEHDVAGIAGRPYLPSAAWATAGLYEAPPPKSPGINATTLSILIHQDWDPANDVSKGGGFGPGQMAANYATLVSRLNAGDPTLLYLQAPPSSYHAVVAYGVYTPVGGGPIQILTTDPNAHQDTIVGYYTPGAQTFYLNDSINFTAFELPTSPLPSTVGPNWFVGGSWGSPTWYGGMSNGYYFVAGIVALTVNATPGGSDYFTDFPGANSQSFVGGIPNSAGIEEPYSSGVVQVYAIPYNPSATYTVTDPSPEVGPLQVIFAHNISGVPTLRGFDLNITSTGMHDYSASPRPNGTVLRILGQPLTANMSFSQVVGNNRSIFNASGLDFPADSVAAFQVHDWSTLGATLTPEVYVNVTTDNGTGVTTEYALTNNQTGLGSGHTLVYAVTFGESGLPGGKPWKVSLNGTVQTAAGPSKVFEFPNGTYAYLISGPAGYRVAGIPPSGTVTVAAGPRWENFTFVRQSTYSITFRESGLPTGESWCVLLSGLQSCSGRSSDVYRNLTPGSYSYAVLPMTGQVITAKLLGSPVALSGTLTITSRSFTMVLKYVYPYVVTFTESGLPTGTNWNVTVRGVTENSTTNTITFNEGNGTYGYRVGAETGFAYTKSPSLVHVLGGPASALVTFHSRSGLPGLLLVEGSMSSGGTLLLGRPPGGP
jgi:hypothetical protein